MKGGVPSEAAIRARAYEIYLERGGRSGHDADDWLQAEYELMQLPIREIAEMPSTRPMASGVCRSALVRLVQAALVLGAEALPLWKG